ncbi:MAG: hypothetical protein NTX88_11220 [Candidatus Atribacteria bacterium]|nr:hypothetical protein [Candidatus Atribacteria bacterium]
MKRNWFSHVGFALLLFTFVLGGCTTIIVSSTPNPTSTSQTPAPSPTSSVLVLTTVTVGPSGGFADVFFTTSNGKKIRITLTATNPSQEPYGYLQYPDGNTTLYTPSIETSGNGVNSSELVLTQTGQYTLTVFDGSNQGGTVNVKIEIV